ncbi:hypothetical protein LMH87_003343 [Akanthomyces muscarius]|uniref:Uncharacterized protein n=1 Tax=Akanthomyces muscarius TaxID=2231603 RepID=A0A9W8Q343_AKAMU|nr:hypothetical protein LMH87_003343 [Akanthomyces muscarius]KAJ4144461.1 hypothetical protein LMH87_003343 [Akanthomyces muscarius]
MATLAPPLSPRQCTGFFELPHKKWRRRRVTTDLMQQEERDRVAREAELESRARACNFLSTFLHSSPWTDQLDQITIVWDCVPSMEELESYGELDEKEGTRNCRRLFKAVVVWDQQASPAPLPMAMERTSADMTDAWWHAPPDNSFRRGSQETSNSSLASRGSGATNPFSLERDYSTFSSLSSSPCDKSYMASACQTRKRSDSLSAMIPRAISQGYVFAVKKTFGAFSEKQTV